MGIEKFYTYCRLPSIGGIAIGSGTMTIPAKIYLYISHQLPPNLGTWRYAWRKGSLPVNLVSLPFRIAVRSYVALEYIAQKVVTSLKIETID